MYQPTKKTKRIAVRIDDKMRQEIEELSDINCKPASEIIRALIRHALDEMDVMEEEIDENLSSL